MKYTQNLYAIRTKGGKWRDPRWPLASDTSIGAGNLLIFKDIAEAAAKRGDCVVKVKATYEVEEP